MPFIYSSRAAAAPGLNPMGFLQLPEVTPSLQVPVCPSQTLGTAVWSPLAELETACWFHWVLVGIEAVRQSMWGKSYPPRKS